MWICVKSIPPRWRSGGGEGAGGEVRAILPKQLQRLGRTRFHADLL
jgi:hypothetical protein